VTWRVLSSLMRRVVTFGLLWALVAGIAVGADTPDEIILGIQQLLSKNDFSAAGNALAVALKRDPANGGLYNLRGILEAQQQHYGAAEADFTRAIRLNRQLTGAYLNLGRLYVMRIDSDAAAMGKATNVYSQLLRIHPEMIEATYQLAVLFEWQGEFRRSLQELTRLPEAEQVKSRVLALRCADLAGIGEVANAEKTGDDLLGASDLSEHDVLDTLPVLTRTGRQDILCNLLEGLEKRQLASSGTLVRLAETYESLHRFAEARQTLERASQREPQSAATLLALARVAEKQHDLEGALGYLAHARDLEPNDPAVHFFFGIVSIELDLPVEAKRSLERALKINPENAYYHYALGSVEVEEKVPGDAIPHFRKYVAARPNDPRGHLALGIAEFASGDYEQARQEMNAVAGIHETAAGAEYFLGRIAKLDGKLDEAAEHLARSIHEDPDYAESRAELGKVRLLQRNYDQARLELEKALKVDPNSYLVNLNLLELYRKTKDSRAEAQVHRVEELEQKRSQKRELMLRTIQVQPN
jgi:tetratricopeptide (TPR) repeat protein